MCDDGWDENAIKVFCNNPYTEGEECCVMTEEQKEVICVGHGRDATCAITLSSSTQHHISIILK